MLQPLDYLGLNGICREVDGTAAIAEEPHRTSDSQSRSLNCFNAILRYIGSKHNTKRRVGNPGTLQRRHKLCNARGWHASPKCEVSLHSPQPGTVGNVLLDAAF